MKRSELKKYLPKIRRTAKVTPAKGGKYTINRAESAALLASCLYGSDFYEQESFGIIVVNRNNDVIGAEIIFRGGASTTLVDSKVVMKYALDYPGACGIFAFHNHPSGTLRPSDADNKITKKLANACKVLSLSFLDHIILGSQSGASYYAYSSDASQWLAHSYGL